MRNNIDVWGVGIWSLNHVLKVLDVCAHLGLVCNKDLKVVNDPRCDNPIYVPSTKKVVLTLEGDFYMQASFQFSHEIIHHFVYSAANISNYKEGVKKISEITASAFSLFVIYLLWSKADESNKKSWEKYYFGCIEGFGKEKSLYYEYREEILELHRVLLINPEEIKKYIELSVIELAQAS